MQQSRRDTFRAHPGKDVCSRKQNLQRWSKGNEKRRADILLGLLGGIPVPGSDRPFEYYVIPSEVMANNVSEAHEVWLSTPGKKGQAHKDNPVRTVHLPPYKSVSGWDISSFRDRWELIERVLNGDESNAKRM